MLNPPQDDEPRGPGGRRTVAAAVLGVVVVVAVAVVALTLQGGDEATPTAAGSATTRTSVTTAALTSTTTGAPASTTTTAADPGSCTYPASGTAARPVTPPAATAPTTGTFSGELTTTAGAIPYTLDRALAPCTVASLVSLAAQGYFDDAPCTRLTTATIFVLQCGDPTGTGTGGPGYTVPDELPTTPDAAGLYYPRGTIAMANDGTPNSSGSQFFLVYRDSPLPPTYTVVGTVTEVGLATLDAVAAAGTVDGAPEGAPATPVTILALSGS